MGMESDWKTVMALILAYMTNAHYEEITTISYLFEPDTI